MTKTAQSLLEQVKNGLKENGKNLSKLVDQKNEIVKAFDAKVEQLLKEKGVIKRIKVPKTFKINFRSMLSMPFIYGMIFPAFYWHIGIEIYHQICFRLYGIPLVNHKEYFVNDRQLLSWLNWIERVNCMYCSYVNNLIRYSAEIGGRTERYWCPIKYYRRIENAHSQYSKFIEKSDPKVMRQQWLELKDFSDMK